MPGTTISQRIEDEIRQALQSFADEDQRSLSSYIAKLLREHGACRKSPKKPKADS